MALPDQASYYDMSPLEETLERFVDFDRINGSEIRVSVGDARAHRRSRCRYHRLSGGGEK